VSLLSFLVFPLSRFPPAPERRPRDRRGAVQAPLHQHADRVGQSDPRRVRDAHGSQRQLSQRGERDRVREQREGGDVAEAAEEPDDEGRDQEQRERQEVRREVDPALGARGRGEEERQQDRLRQREEPQLAAGEPKKPSEGPREEDPGLVEPVRRLVKPVSLLGVGASESGPDAGLADVLCVGREGFFYYYYFFFSSFVPGVRRRKNKDRKK
jgi:hypothetical protein